MKPILYMLPLFWGIGTNAQQNCDGITWIGASSPGFDQNERDIMYNNFIQNLNIAGSGAVIASSDNSTSGGSYFYHWVRDAGLSLTSFMEINNLDYAVVRQNMDAYLTWVEGVHAEPEVNGIDVRVEPRFYVPSGDVYDGGWCRPQSDGPALRAMAMAFYGQILFDNGEDTTRVYDRILHDLEWIENHWDSDSCDLWETIVSNDFYHNRAAMVYALNIAANLAEDLGNTYDMNRWRGIGNQIRSTLDNHWNATGGYIYESTNRPVDGTIMQSVARFGEYTFGATSNEAAGTISVLSETFCNLYPINWATTDFGLPGIVIGRYVDDQYYGGNPWTLLCAALGEVFYAGAQGTFKDIQARGENPFLNRESHGSWMDLLELSEEHTLADLATRQLQAGDGAMNRLYSYVNGDGMRIDEEIDRETGEQLGSEGLTWSYANILHALWVRDNAALLKEQVLGNY